MQTKLLTGGLMKYMKKNILIILCLIFAVTIGCKKEVEKTADIPVVQISNAAVEFAYKDAMRLYSRTTMGILDHDSSDRMPDNPMAYRVTEGNVKSLKDLDAYLKKHFSNELTTKIMEMAQSNPMETLTEHGGKLYTTAQGGRGDNMCLLGETYTYTKDGGNKIIMHVKVELDPACGEGNYKNYDFVYENLDGKKWVFTSFPFFS